MSELNNFEKSLGDANILVAEANDRIKDARALRRSAAERYWDAATAAAHDEESLPSHRSIYSRAKATGTVRGTASKVATIAIAIREHGMVRDGSESLSSGYRRAKAMLDGEHSTVTLTGPDGEEVSVTDAEIPDIKCPDPDRHERPVCPDPSAHIVDDGTGVERLTDMLVEQIRTDSTTENVRENVSNVLGTLTERLFALADSIEADGDDAEGVRS